VSEQPHRLVVLRLSLEGSVLVVVVALLLWGILTIGSQGAAAERHSLSALTALAPSTAGSAAPQARGRERQRVMGASAWRTSVVLLRRGGPT
jgi:hypothetical protein